MTKIELIEFGRKLIDKGRTPKEIYDSISIKASSKKMLNEVIKEIYRKKGKIKKRSPEQVKVLLKANKIKLDFEFDLKGLIRVALCVLTLGGIVYGLSSRRVNQNEIFGWITILQGLITLTLYYFVKFKNNLNLLLVTVILYFSIWGIELFIWEVPNDLLNAYNVNNINIPPSLKININTGAARLIGFMFPFLYLFFKLFFGLIMVNSFWRYKKYNNLPNEIKEELKTF
jgi:hypothetical protein